MDAVRLLSPVICENKCEWRNLQGGSASAEAADLPMRLPPNVIDSAMVSLAATIANLDLVLTVDTLAAHLAGALGIRTWVMLKYQADWR